MKLGSHSPVLSYLFLRESLPWSLSISLSTLSILANFFFPPLHFLYPISIFGSLCLDSSLSFAFVVVQSLSCVWLCGLHELQLTRLPCPSPSPGAVQTQGHWVDNAIQPSHPLPLSSPFAFSLSQHQGLFQWVGSSHQECILWLILIQDMSSFWSLLLGTTTEDRKELNFPFPSCLRNSTEDVLNDSSCEATITLFSPVSFAHNIKCRKMRNGLFPSM